MSRELIQHRIKGFLDFAAKHNMSPEDTARVIGAAVWLVRLMSRWRFVLFPFLDSSLKHYIEKYRQGGCLEPDGGRDKFEEEYLSKRPRRFAILKSIGMRAVRTNFIERMPISASSFFVAYVKSCVKSKGGSSATESLFDYLYNTKF